MLQLKFNPGLALTGFRTTRPCMLIIFKNINQREQKFGSKNLEVLKIDRGYMYM